MIVADRRVPYRAPRSIAFAEQRSIAAGEARPPQPALMSGDRAPETRLPPVLPTQLGDVGVVCFERAPLRDRYRQASTVAEMADDRGEALADFFGKFGRAVLTDQLQA